MKSINSNRRTFVRHSLRQINRRDLRWNSIFVLWAYELLFSLVWTLVCSPQPKKKLNTEKLWLLLINRNYIINQCTRPPNQHRHINCYINKFKWIVFAQQKRKNEKLKKNNSNNKIRCKVAAGWATICTIENISQLLCWL